MKKLFVYGLSIALVAGAASCKKSSKGKLSNEWKMSTMTQESSDTDENGDTEKMTMTIADGVVTQVMTDAAGDKTTITGTVTTADWTIAKDGTWSRTLEMNFDTYSFGGNDYDVDYTQKSEDSGSWDFMNGVSKDFKKNERVVFNTLMSKSTTIDATSGTASTDVSSETFGEGENSDVMVVVESKGKMLTLSSDEDNSSSYTPDGGTASTSSSTSTMTIELIQE